MFMDKPQEEQQVEKKIGQLQNRQKILLNKKTQRGTPGQDAPADWTRGHFGGRFPCCCGDGGRGSQGVLDCPLPSAGSAGVGGKNAQKRGCGVIPSPSPANKSQERKRKNTGSRYAAKRAQENRGSDGPQKFASDVSSSFWQRQIVMPVLLR